MTRVLFLCTGNYFRSRFAQEWFNAQAQQRGLSDRLQASSAGLNVHSGSGNVGAMALEAIEALEQRGIPLVVDELAMPRQVTEALLQSADRVVAVDEDAHRPMVQALFPAWEEAICFWSIKDLGEGDPAVDPIAAIEHKLNSLLDELS